MMNIIILKTETFNFYSFVHSETEIPEATRHCLNLLFIQYHLLHYYTSFLALLYLSNHACLSCRNGLRISPPWSLHRHGCNTLSVACSVEVDFYSLGNSVLLSVLDSLACFNLTIPSPQRLTLIELNIFYSIV